MKDVTIVRAVNRNWIVLVNGFQWGGEVDKSGAGNAEFPTREAARKAYDEERRSYESSERNQ